MDDQPEQAVAGRRRTDQGPLLGRDADRDEALDPAELIDDPEGRIAGIGEGAHALDDELEHGVEVEHARDRARRGVERLEGVDGEGRAAVRR